MKYKSILVLLAIALLTPSLQSAFAIDSGSTMLNENLPEGVVLSLYYRSQEESDIPDVNEFKLFGLTEFSGEKNTIAPESVEGPIEVEWGDIVAINMVVRAEELESYSSVYIGTGCDGGTITSTDGTWNSGEHYYAFGALASCTDVVDREIKATKKECVSSCFTQGFGGRKGQAKEDAIMGILRRCGEDRQFLADMCEKDVRCSLTTDECRAYRFYSADGDNADDYDLTLETTGCPEGQKRYRLKKIKGTKGSTLNYDVDCECTPRH
ncbi:hypothetical protein OAO01_00580 [Oligoflexia bacterium]|nr:hypothetical protein [Oligoflexia bacterium]